MNDLSKHRLMLPPEQLAIRDKCFHPSGTFVEFKKEEIEQSIPERFEKIVAMYPDRLAVKMGNRPLTYDELNRAANRIARAILAQGGNREAPVALLLGHDATMLAAIIGVMKSGKVWVPLATGYPPARIRHIFHDSKATLIVTDNAHLSVSNQLVNNSLRLINIDELDSGLTDQNIGLSIPPETLAYILYTSGSTGQPKGVTQAHRNVLHNVRAYIDSLHIGTDDRLTLLASCSGGQGMATAFSALLSGAALYPWNIQEEGLANLASWLITEGITVYISGATVFRSFATTLTKGEQFPSLRLVRVGNEPVRQSDVELYKKHFSPDCIFVNWFASSEAGNISCYFIDKKTNNPVEILPIGFPFDDTEVLLLDDRGQRVGFNKIGEIAIRSRYLSPGYWGRPDLTQAKFFPDPNGGEERLCLSGDLGLVLSDGCLSHVGRKDFQVKVRGNRVEVGEIETTLLSLDAIKGAVVTTQDRTGDKRLVAYIVPADKPRPNVAALRRALAEKLPDHMIPSAFVLLDALPLTPNGKVDRRALPDPGNSRSELDTPYVAPRTPIETELEQIWAEILSLDKVGIHDSFLDLGGNSLLATQIISKVFDTFRVEVPLPSFFGAPTVVDMAAVIAENQEKQLGEIERIIAEVDSMSDEDARRMAASKDSLNKLKDGDA